MPKFRHEYCLINRPITVTTTDFAGQDMIGVLPAFSPYTATYRFEIVARATAGSVGSISAEGVASIATTAVPTSYGICTATYAANHLMGSVTLFAYSPGTGKTLDIASAKIIVTVDYGNYTPPVEMVDIELGSYSSITSTSLGPLSKPKYFFYDSSRWTSPTAPMLEYVFASPSSKSSASMALQVADGTGDGFVGWTTVANTTVSTNSLTGKSLLVGGFVLISGRNYRIVASSPTSKSAAIVYNAKLRMSVGLAAAPFGGTSPLFMSSNPASGFLSGGVALSNTNNNAIMAHDGKCYRFSSGSWAETQPAGAVTRAWGALAISLDGGRMAASCSSATTGYVWTHNGTSWTQHTPNGTDNQWDVVKITTGGNVLCCTGKNIIGGGKLFYYDGASWTLQPVGDLTNYADGFFDCCLSDNASIRFAVSAKTYGASGHWLYSGGSWSAVSPAGTAVAGQSCACSSDGTKIITTGNSRLWLSTNSGVSWTEQQPAGNVARTWAAVKMSPDGTRMLAYCYGTPTGYYYYNGSAWSGPFWPHNATVADVWQMDLIDGGYAAFINNGNAALYFTPALFGDLDVGITKFEDRYDLAMAGLDAGTGLNSKLCNWDSTEWSGGSNTYSGVVDAANGSASDVEIRTSDDATLVATVSNPDNQGTGTATMPTSQNLDCKATTNNSDIYSVRLLVAVVVGTASAIKTDIGLAVASVKTVVGLVLASTKTQQGLA